MNQMESYKSLKNQVFCDNRPLSKCAPKMNPILYSSVSPSLSSVCYSQSKVQDQNHVRPFPGWMSHCYRGKDVEG